MAAEAVPARRANRCQQQNVALLAKGEGMIELPEKRSHLQRCEGPVGPPIRVCRPCSVLNRWLTRRKNTRPALDHKEE